MWISKIKKHDDNKDIEHIFHTILLLPINLHDQFYFGLVLSGGPIFSPISIQSSIYPVVLPSIFIWSIFLKNNLFFCFFMLKAD